MSQILEEVHLTTIKPKNNVLLLAQEISFAKVLACNDKRLRDRGLRRLKKWLMARSQSTSEFTKEDHMRIWKGLFYCMWMSDKPLIQEELAEDISQLIHSFASFKASLLFVKTFFNSLSNEWFGIDQLRLDKFMMLVRRCVRQSFELAARNRWTEEKVEQIANMYYDILISAPLGLSMHIIEVFCEELAKVGKGKLSSSTILQFLTIFVRLLSSQRDGRMISQITRYVFLHLIRQTELGIEHQMKFSAWKEYGFPGGDVDAAEKVEVESLSDEDELMMGSEDELEEKRQVGIDARAGNVDVLLPPLDFDPVEVIKVVTKFRNSAKTTTKARVTLMQLITKFQKLASGTYPLGLHKVELPEKTNKKKEIDQIAKKLFIDEKRLLAQECDADEDGVDKIPLSKKIAKKIEKKSVKSTWKVSLQKSKRVNEKPKPNVQGEKRKINDDDNPDSVISKKKTKVCVFHVSDSKENSFPSPITSTPMKTDKTNILRKASSYSMIMASEKTKCTPQKLKIKQKANKSNRIQDDSESTNPMPDTINSVSAENVTSINDTSTPKCKKKTGGENTVILLNTTADKNNGWGGEWDNPTENIEYDMFIPNKKYVQKRKSQGLPYPVSSFVQKTPEDNNLNLCKRKSITSSGRKKVEFDLNANKSQEYKEYTKKVKSSKSQVPFDATKKPVQGLLKSFTPSPINPFYKKKLITLLKSPSNNKSFT